MLASTHAAGRMRAMARTTDAAAAPSLAVDLAPDHPRGLRLRAPVLTASGTFGFGDEYRDIVNLAELGAIVTKTVTPEPPGRQPHAANDRNAGRHVELDRPAEPRRRRGGAGESAYLGGPACPVVVSIAAHDPESWTTLAARFDGLDNVVAIEANLSCPNVAGGLDYSTDPSTTAATVRAVRRGVSLPVIAKLSPNVTDLRPIARAAEEAGADALSLINTLLGMVTTPGAALPFLGAGVGGLSGPAIRPLAVRCVHGRGRRGLDSSDCMGGVVTTDDALQFLMAGASAVQVGTATFREPRTAERIVDGLRGYLASRGLGL